MFWRKSEDIRVSYNIHMRPMGFEHSPWKAKMRRYNDLRFSQRIWLNTTLDRVHRTSGRREHCFKRVVNNYDKRPWGQVTHFCRRVVSQNESNSGVCRRPHVKATACPAEPKLFSSNVTKTSSTHTTWTTVIRAEFRHKVENGFS